MVIAIDTRALGDSVRWEPASNGGPFPHVYAPLSLSAVVAVHPIADPSSVEEVLPREQLGRVSRRPGPLNLRLPDLATVRPVPIGIATVPAVLILKLRWPVPWVLGISAVLGLAATLAHGLA
ncbi:MAG: hypothetical protein QOD41_3613 [Cryptosporangiaceae bacterium]|nr:hypothetical protein [Cryptosporangiaceae bacterium]